MMTIYKIKFYLIIAFLYCIGSCSNSYNQNIKENKSKINHQIKTNSIDWELNKDTYYCKAEGLYPQIISNDNFCNKINITIYELVQNKLEGHKETCTINPELLETINDGEHSLFLSFKGGINHKIISIGIYSIEKALGAAYSQYNYNYYNFNLLTKQSMLISDFINLNKDFENTVFEQLKFDNDYSKKDSLLISDYLHQPPKVKYSISQDYLEISLNYLQADLNFDSKQDFIHIPIEDISNLLKIPIKDLPIF